MKDLPDYNKITFPENPAIPLEEIVPDASAQVLLLSILRPLETLILSRLLCMLEFLTCETFSKFFSLQISNLFS